MSNVTTIVASQWSCGEKDPQDTSRFLINNADGHCCLGFDGLARGYSEERLKGKRFATGLYSDAENTVLTEYGQSWTEYGQSWSVSESDYDTTLEDKAIKVNDSRDPMTKRARFELLVPIFAEAGRELRFIDDESADPLAHQKEEVAG